MNDVTLHVHGMDKMNMWYTDGVAFMQQCPIDVGTKYVSSKVELQHPDCDTKGAVFNRAHTNGSIVPSCS